jgi:hypothetical protein
MGSSMPANLGLGDGRKGFHRDCPVQRHPLGFARLLKGSGPAIDGLRVLRTDSPVAITWLAQQSMLHGEHRRGRTR